jgi:hypothetical protein
MLRKFGFLAMTLVTGALATNSPARESVTEASNKSPPVFLLSERDLGSGFKVCFLSNGLQMRIATSQPCPYPLKAPPFIEPKREPKDDAGIAANSQPVIEPKSKAENSAVAPSVVQAKPLQPSQQTQLGSSIPANLVPSNPQPSDQVQASKVEVAIAKQNDIQPLIAKQPSHPIVQPSEDQIAQADDDEIATKAIRRCERIGFVKGSEPFKSCALEQIRLLTVVKP